MERIAVVDAADRFLRFEPRELVHRTHLFHRTVHIALFDSQGRLVLQRRHASKGTYPRCWDISACGHVDEADYPAGLDERLDEVYRRAALRELREELGVETALEQVAHFGPIDGVSYEQMRLFKGVSDGPFRSEPTEIEEIKAFTPPELKALLSSSELRTMSLPFLLDYLESNAR